MKYQQKKCPTLQSGFTFFELIIVATIIGILAAIALPNYYLYQNSAKLTEAFSLSSTARNEIAEFYRQTGSLPIDNQAAGLPESKQLSGKYIRSLKIDHGVIILQFKDNIGEELSNKRLSIRPRIVVNSPTTPLIFSCGDDSRPLPKGIIAVGSNATTIDSKLISLICR